MTYDEDEFVFPLKLDLLSTTESTCYHKGKHPTTRLDFGFYAAELNISYSYQFIIFFTPILAWIWA